MTGFQWTDRDVRLALGLRASEDEATTFTGISTDSRSTHPGELYVALQGNRFDGHAFVPQALAAGARGAVVAQSTSTSGAGDVIVYHVADTLEALGSLAAYRRRLLPARVVGITGSSGKTGTKDLTAGALSSRLDVHATPGNFNNRVGLPLTLLSAPPDADVVVAEMGSNEPGEIRLLADITRPDVGVITTVAESHLEGLGSLEGVLAEKLALFEALEPDGNAVVGEAPPRLPIAARQVFPATRVAGWSGRADVGLRPSNVSVDATGAYTFTWREAVVSLSVLGRHSVYNALLALAVAEFLGVAPSDAARGLAGVRAAPLRGQVLEIGGVRLILDCYNANPQSVAAAMELLECQESDGRVAVLGTMLELGPQSDELHRQVLEDALARDITMVVATGAFATAADVAAPGPTGAGPEMVVWPDPTRLAPILAQRLRGDEVVLLKASRGVALESLVPELRAELASAGVDAGDMGVRLEVEGPEAGGGQV